MSSTDDTIIDLEPRVRHILSQLGARADGLVQVLREVQEEFGYLPDLRSY